MKKLLLIGLMILLATSVFAADVTLRWDPNDPTPEGYRVFMKGESDPYDYATPAWQGPQTQTTLEGLVEGEAKAFVVRAYDGEMESADSDEVQYTPPMEQKVIVYPHQPKSITIVFDSQ